MRGPRVSAARASMAFLVLQGVWGEVSLMMRLHVGKCWALLCYICTERVDGWTALPGTLLSVYTVKLKHDDSEVYP